MPKGRQRIYSAKNMSLNEQERLDLSRLLVKAGYAVKIGREKQEGKANAPYVYFVEYWEDEAE